MQHVLRKTFLPPELLRELLQYDADTGRLYWRKRSQTLFSSAAQANCWNGRFAGREAFTHRDGKGYCVGKIFRSIYKAHRVAWAIHFGEWPAQEIDHINGNQSDNRIDNLRAASPNENAWNRGPSAINTSGVKGVNWHKKQKRWVARITYAGKRHNLGSFHAISDAAAAYAEAAARLHGEFARAA